MYQYVDRPLSTLDEGCRFLTGSMRVWVAALARRQCPARMLAPAFAKWRMIGALQPFHRMMIVLNHEALETLQFCPAGCDYVSEHEALLLELVTSIHARGPLETRATLDLLVSEDAVGDMLDVLTRIAAALAIAGIFPGEAAGLRDLRS